MPAIPPFYEIRLPLEISQDAVGGFDYPVKIIGERDSGIEARNLEADQPTGDWDIQYGIRSALRTAYQIWMIAHARYGGFRFQAPDPDEHAIGTADQLNDPPQILATGDGVTTQFQLQKRFAMTDLLGATQVTLVDIKKPAFGEPLLISVNDVLVAESASGSANFTVDRTTGMVTFNSAPADGASIKIVSCLFDIPVRFADRARIKTTLYTSPDVSNQETEPIMLQAIYLP